MRLPIEIDSAAVAPGLRQVENLVDTTMARMQARINAVKGPSFTGGAGGGLGMYADMRMANKEVSGIAKTLTGMGSLTTGLGLGAAVGGAALLEQSLERSIRKAKEFQTATLAIAATLGSVGEWKAGPGGRTLPAQQQTQRNMWAAEKYRMQILERSAKNILTFEEQLQSFQSGLSSGSRKGLTPDQIMKLTEQTAVVAKTLGLRGEQIANASRLMMGGGVNISRSTIGRALGLTNADIATRQGPELEKFLMKRMKGFEAMQGQFENSIEGLTSTMTAKIDVMASKVGEKFFKGIAPTMKQIGLLNEPSREDYKSEGEYKKAVASYQKQSQTMDKVVGAAAEAFNGLFEGVKSVVESDTFSTLLDILVQIAKVSKTIMLAAIFSKIAGAVGAATGALSKFLTMARSVGAVGGGGGGAGGGVGITGIMPADIVANVLTGGGGRGLRGGGGTSGLAGTLGLAGFGGGTAEEVARRFGVNPEAKYATRMRQMRGLSGGKAGMAEAMVMALGYGAAGLPQVQHYGPSFVSEVEKQSMRAGRRDYTSMRKGLRGLTQEEAVLANRSQFLGGKEQQAAMERLNAINMEKMALTQQMSMIPYGALPTGAKFGRRWGAFTGHAQQALPIAMMGLMGGQLAKDLIPGTFGDVLGNVVQGGSLGYLGKGLRPGLTTKSAVGAGVVAGLGTSITDYYSKKSMEDLNKGTTAGQYGGMAAGGAMKWGAAGFMLGGPLGAAGGAVAGAVLEPLISSMQKAQAQAEASAKALDEMTAKFPQAAQVAKTGQQVRGIEEQLKTGRKPSTQRDPSWLARQYWALSGWMGAPVKVTEEGRKLTSTERKELSERRDALKARQAQERTVGVFEGDQGLTEELTKRKTQLDLLSQYGGKSIDTQIKLTKLQAEYAAKSLEKDKSQIPVDFDMEAFSKKMKDTKNPEYQKWQQEFKKWRMGRTDEEVKGGKADYASFIAEKAGNEERRLQEAAVPGMKAEVRAAGAAAIKGLQLQAGAMSAAGQDRGSLAAYKEFQGGLYEKAPLFKGGMESAEFKKYQGGMMKQYNRDLREQYDVGMLGLQGTNLERTKLGLERSRLREDTSLKLSHLQLDAQRIDITGQQTKLESQRLGLQSQQIDLTGEKLGLQAQALQDEKTSTMLNIAKGQTSMKRLTEDYQISKPEAQMNYQGALLNERRANVAPELFYGNLGPTSEAAGAIRYKVESEFASKFDPGKYEDAYRESLKIQEDQMGVDKQLAEQNTKRAALGLDRIEEDYAAAMADLTVQLRGMERHMAEIGISEKENSIAQQGNKLDKSENALAQKGLTLKEQENALADKENKIATQRTVQDANLTDKELALKQQGVELQDRKQRRELGELGKTIKETGGGNIPGLPGVGAVPALTGNLPTGIPGGVPTGNPQFTMPGGMPGGLGGSTVMPGQTIDMGNGVQAVAKMTTDGKLAFEGANGYSIMDQTSKGMFERKLEEGKTGEALQLSNPMMTQNKLERISSLPAMGQEMGYENSAIHAAYARPLGSKKDWERVRSLMDNGMTKSQASQQIINSNAQRAYQEDVAKQQKVGAAGAAGGSGNISISAPVSITSQEKIDPASLRRDFETWLNDWCRTQKLKGGG
jgi:hypothetical protein